MEKLKNMTLKKSFFLIVSAATVVVVILSAVSVRFCSNTHDRITLSHAFMTDSAAIPNNAGAANEPGTTNGTVVISPDGGWYFMETETLGTESHFAAYTPEELLLCRILELGIVLLPVSFSLAGIGCAGTFFYHVKLKAPLKALRQGIGHIAENDLDFAIDCRWRDELGELCSAFEAMRRELVKNNRSMWNLAEERRKINASISHDLRTPITVIKGYSEYLEKNAGREALTEEGTRAIAAYIRQAADRLAQYADSVHEVQALEDMALEYQEVSLPRFAEELRSQLALMAGQSGKEIALWAELPERNAVLAPAAVFRILENIVSNALRFCEEKIRVDLSFSPPFLSMVITDDGKGFSQKDLAEATDYFYKGKSSKGHFGIGLSICRTLAEKHGGKLSIENAPGTGARVTVKINGGKCEIKY